MRRKDVCFVFHVRLFLRRIWSIVLCLRMAFGEVDAANEGFLQGP